MVTDKFLKNGEKDYEKLERSLKELDKDGEDMLLVSEQCLIEIDTAIRKLKGQVVQHLFGSIAEEVYFFKHIKPRFISRYLYYGQVLNIESERPRSGKRALKRFYVNKIKELNIYFTDTKDFYNYYKREATYLDHKYFVRNAYDLKMKLPDHLYSYDDGFTTFHDHQVAMILANDDVIRFLTSRIQKLEDGRVQKNALSQDLKWTAPKVALIELIYALHQGRCFNGGVLGLGETVKIFEGLLDIDMGNFHKVVSEIRSRKNNRTKFLQHLQDNLHQLFLDNDR